MIRRRNLYGIFLRMIQHLLWISRHQKGGDLRADLQRAVGGKGPNERKSFPRSDPQNEQYYPMELSRSQYNFIEITLLVQDFLPVAFCLQETHLKKNDNINLKNYSVYSTYVDENERAAGGSTILVRDNILHSYVNLNTDLQAVAVRITLDKTVTLCSVYIPLLWT